MKEIVAKNQVELGSGRCMQLALSGIRFRLFRSMITIAILGLAVAFLAHMLGYSVMSGATRRAVWDEMERERSLGIHLRRMESPDPLAAVLSNLQRQEPARSGEYRAWAAQDEAAWEETLERIATLTRFQESIHNLTPRHRAILVGDRDELALLANLERDTAREAFLRRLQQIEVPVPLGGREALDRFVKVEWPALQSTLRGIRAGHRRSIGLLEAGLQGRELFEALIQDPEQVAELAREAGLSTVDIDFGRLAGYAGDIRIQRQLEEALGMLQVRRDLARLMDENPAALTPVTLYRWVGEDDAHAQSVEARLRSAGLEAAPSAAAIRRVAANVLHQRRLQALVPREPDAAENAFGLDSGSRWLIGLAFMVCVIGVANAMLMSVTERFTEIATMKCLGAMDQFIMTMFVFEAAIQGLIGGLAGALLGVLLAWVRGASEYGGALVAGPVMGMVLLSALLSLVVGVLLAILAAVGPSFTAARLAPMEAMRVD